MVIGSFFSANCGDIGLGGGELLRRLKVVNGLDFADDIGGGLDVFYDFGEALISHRRLVEGVGDDAGGVDARHFCLVFRHSKALEGG